MADGHRMHLARNIRRLRESRGMSAEEVCARLGFSFRLYEIREAGKGKFPQTWLVELCQLFGYYDIYKMMTVEIRFSFNPALKN